MVTGCLFFRCVCDIFGWIFKNCAWAGRPRLSQIDLIVFVLQTKIEVLPKRDSQRYGSQVGVSAFDHEFASRDVVDSRSFLEKLGQWQTQSVVCELNVDGSVPVESCIVKLK